MFVLLTGLIIAACAGGNVEKGAQPAPSEESIRVNVRNDAFQDATIYLLQTGAARRRLGTVGSLSNETFTLPRYLTTGVTELRFVVDYIGRRNGAVSETILATPGDEIQLTIRR
jgi:hypothetical protein